MKKLILAAASLIVFAGAATAHDYKIGDLVINHPVLRATPVNAPVSGGYMTIQNNGTDADRLIGAEVTFAGKAEVHEMTMDGDVMKMREIEGGVEIPAGEQIKLMPGGFHLMFMDLQNQLNEGDKYDATLMFEKAGSVDVTLNVETLAQIRESLADDGMDHSQMDHSNHGGGDMKKAE